MSYLLMIVEPVGQREQVGEEEGRLRYDSMLRFSGDLKSRGVLGMSQSLRSETLRLQVREGKRSFVDGPYMEAKEMIGGFFLLECATREEAIAIATECPAAAWATVEVRELGPCFT